MSESTLAIASTTSSQIWTMGFSSLLKDVMLHLGLEFTNLLISCFTKGGSPGSCNCLPSRDISSSKMLFRRRLNMRGVWLVLLLLGSGVQASPVETGK